MFSQHPFTIEHRFSLDAALALPAWKRALDVMCCFAALPVLALLTFVYCLVSRVCSRGPIFYRQRHVGYMGRSFAAYRFRTMRVVSPARALPTTGANPTSTCNDEAPLIPGGRFLRASGLADLPQILNVLRGEMSIVGTRPCTDSRDVPQDHGQRNDSSAVPGLTGPWRLATNSPNPPEELTRWEQTYPGRMSLGHDLKVIGRALFAIICLRHGR